MNLTIFVEPGPAGFRATTGGPPPLTADGPTADAAVAAVQAQYAARLAAGGEVRTVSVTPAPAVIPTDDIAAIAARMRANPLFEEYEAAVEQWRREYNAVPEENEAA